MTIIEFPEPETPTFEMLMRNPNRDRAEGVIQAFIHGMKEEGIDRATIIRTLFHHVIEELKAYPIDGSETQAEDAEHLNMMNEIDERWSRIRNALTDVFPDMFKTPR